MRRVAVLGPSGAGKSTVARRLGAELRLPVTHLDSLYWAPGWTPVRPAAFAAAHDALIAQERWVLDGNYASMSSLSARIARADLVVLVEASRGLRLARVVRRWARHRGRERPDLGAGCPERLDPAFLRWTWRWDRLHPGFAVQVRELAGSTPVEVVRSRGYARERPSA